VKNSIRLTIRRRGDEVVLLIHYIAIKINTSRSAKVRRFELHQMWMVH